MKQLSGKKSRDLGLIISGCNESTRPGSYDVRIDCITVEGKHFSNGAMIPPQAVAILSSVEEIDVKPGYIGYAFPKTSLCNEGIHVLNTGIIDPGFKGRISTIAMNFLSGDKYLEKNEAFLRIVFHKLDTQEIDQTILPITDKLLFKKIRDRSLAFPKSFLDVPGQIRKITAGLIDRQTNIMILLLTIFTIIFAAFSFFGPTLSEFAPHYEAYKTNQDLEPKIMRLEKQIHDLEVQLSKINANNTAPQAPASIKSKAPHTKRE